MRKAVMSMPASDARSDAQSAGFHATVLDGLPEAVIVATPDGRITFINAAAETLLGHDAADVVGASITMLVPRQSDRRVDPVAWLARWAAEPDATAARYVDLIARRADGHEMPVEVRVRAGIVGDPASAGGERFFITVRDNSRRRAEAAALKDANLRAARILMVAEDAIVSVDSHQKIILFNLAAETMFGYRAEEVIGQPLSILIPLAARAAHGRQVEEFGKARDASRMMSARAGVVGVRRSGESFPLEATITKVDAAGALTFTAHLRDVTTRNEVRDRLQESERRTRAVFDHATEALALLDHNGLVLEINRAGTALTKGGVATGVALWELPWLGAGDTAPLRAAIAAAGKGEAASLAAQLQRDGAPLPVDVRLTPIRGDAGVRYILVEGRTA
jgi:PAS domain S-box-containing protein